MRWLSVFAVMALARPAVAEERALFALIVGVNRGVDPDLAPLHYADDDAAEYQAVFRQLGARTYLLSRLDDNTRRLHPQAVAEALDPTEAQWRQTLAQLESDVARARAQHVATTFYFVYAGHGHVQGGEGYVALEDGRLTGRRLEAMVAQSGADETHLIVDACYSFYLAFGRGPGGVRRPLERFSGLHETFKDERVGLLFSTSSARESHEWEAYQSGVFSHEVRSGLRGAADADGDGLVSYREMAAFVERANAAVPNERFRPDVYARPPRKAGFLVDLRAPLGGRRLELHGEAGHFLLEDHRGVRLADFHNASGQPFHLLLPVEGTLYLRRLADDREFALPAQNSANELAALESAPARTSIRGAAHESFGALFLEPFGAASVAKFAFPAVDLHKLEAPFRSAEAHRQRKIAAYSLFGSGAGLAITGMSLSLAGYSLQGSIGLDTPQATVAARNSRIDALNATALAMYATASASGLTAALLLLLPHQNSNWTASIGPNQVQFLFHF